MPHLYLPTDHTDADLVLAADVAAAVSSADLYVTWTLDAGAGAPEIEAVVREERPAPPVNPFAELFVAALPGHRHAVAVADRPAAAADRRRSGRERRAAAGRAAARGALGRGLGRAGAVAGAVLLRPRRPRPRAAWRPRGPTARRTRRATCRPRSASAPAGSGRSGRSGP